MIAEALVATDALQHKPVALTQCESLSVNNVKNLEHCLFMQLRIRGACHVFFLNGRVNESRIMMPVVIILAVHTDAFLKNQPYALPAYPVAEMHRLR